MPHIIVKLWPGKTAEQKQRLTAAIADNVIQILGSGEAAVSIAFEEVDAAEWTSQVYEPDILGRWNDLTKQPGYGERPAREEEAQ